MRKRMASLLCALLLVIGCAVPALAAGQTYTVEEMDLTIDMPEDFYVFDQEDFNVLSPNEDLGAAGFKDPQEQLELMQEYGIYLTAVSPDLNLTINLAKKESTTTQSVYDLTLLSDEEFEDFLDTMRGEDGDTSPEIEA